MVKKLAKALDEMTKNEELMSQLLGAEEKSEKGIKELEKGEMKIDYGDEDDEGEIQQNIDNLYENMEEGE